VVADELDVEVLPVTDRVEHVTLGEDPESGTIGVEHDGRTDAPLGHEPGRSPQRVPGSHREDHLAHSVAYLHVSGLPGRACNDCLNPGI